MIGMNQSSKSKSKSKTRGGLPTFFRGAIADARSSSYENAGYQLAMHARNLIDYSDDGSAETGLDAALGEDDAPSAVLAWMQKELPRCIALVPTRRRATFVRGIERAIEEGRM